MTLQPYTPHTPASPPLCRLEHRATSVLLRDLLADPAVVSEMRADPYIAVQFHDLLNPAPPTHATTSTPPLQGIGPDTAPTSPRPMERESSASASVSPSPRGGGGWGEGSAPETHTVLPLRHRIYALYCEGHTITAIARDLSLDRGTVTRHLRAVETELAADHTADLARLRLRAVEAQYAILAAAWESLAREELRESTELAAAAVAREQGDRPPAPYRAQRARLLSVAAHAARSAAQLQGLFAHPAPITIPADLPADLPAIPAGLPNEPAASCGMPASPAAAPASGVGAHGCAPAAPPTTASVCNTELPVAFNSTARPPTTPPSIEDCPRNSIAERVAEDDPSNSIRGLDSTTPLAHPDDTAADDPGASCGMPASTTTSPAGGVEAHGCAPDPQDYPSN